MKKKKKIIFAAVVLLISLSVYVSNYDPNERETNPQNQFNFSDFQGKTPDESERLLRARINLTDAIEKHPQNSENYVELAGILLREARVAGNDHDLLPEAEELLETALQISPENPAALAMKASLLMKKHRFTEAHALAEKAVEINPNFAFALGVLSDAYLELGKYKKAVFFCDRMIQVRPDLSAYARVSYLRELHGDLPGAISAMRLAADAGIAGQEARAWALFNLGKLYLQNSKADTAEFIFRGILQERSQYAPAYQGLALVLAAREEPDLALQMLRQAHDIKPDHVFKEEMANILRESGDETGAKFAVRQVLRDFRHHEADGWNVNLEFAAFCIRHNIHSEESLQRLALEYKNRPGNIDVLDAYAWALYKAGQAKMALQFIEPALRLNTRRSSLYYHAGMIYAENGQIEKGKMHFQKAIQYTQSPYSSINKKIYEKLRALDTNSEKNHDKLASTNTPGS